MFDVTERVMGLRGVSRDSGNAFPLRAQGGKEAGPYLVSGRAFLVHYGVDTSTSRRRPSEMVDDVLCVDLKAEGVEVTSHRSVVLPTMANDANGNAQEPPPATSTWPSLRQPSD